MCEPLVTCKILSFRSAVLLREESASAGPNQSPYRQEARGRNGRMAFIKMPRHLNAPHAQSSTFMAH
jgi:hypothetical protein